MDKDTFISLASIVGTAVVSAILANRAKYGFAQSTMEKYHKHITDMKRYEVEGH